MSMTIIDHLRQLLVTGGTFAAVVFVYAKWSLEKTVGSYLDAKVQNLATKERLYEVM